MHFLKITISSMHAGDFHCIRRWSPKRTVRTKRSTKLISNFWKPPHLISNISTSHYEKHRIEIHFLKITSPRCCRHTCAPFFSDDDSTLLRSLNLRHTDRLTITHTFIARASTKEDQMIRASDLPTSLYIRTCSWWYSIKSEFYNENQKRNGPLSEVHHSWSEHTYVNVQAELTSTQQPSLPVHAFAKGWHSKKLSIAFARGAISLSTISKNCICSMWDCHREIVRMSQNAKGVNHVHGGRCSKDPFAVDPIVHSSRVRLKRLSEGTPTLPTHSPPRSIGLKIPWLIPELCVQVETRGCANGANCNNSARVRWVPGISRFGVW